MANNLDLIVVKMAFTPDEAGMYSQASAIARMISYISGPVVAAMAPKIVSLSSRRSSVAHTFGRALGLCVLITVGAAGFCWLFPALPLRVLAPGGIPTLFPLVRIFVWAFAPMPVLIMLINFLMARRSFRFLFVLAPLCAVYALTIGLWHPGQFQVVVALGCAGVLLTAVTGGFAWAELRRESA